MSCGNLKPPSCDYQKHFYGFSCTKLSLKYLQVSYLSYTTIIHITRCTQNDQVHNCAKMKRGCEKESWYPNFSSYLHRVWKPGRHTQITPEVLPEEQT